MIRRAAALLTTVRLRRATLTLLLALGTFTTLYRIDAPSMWLDEIYHRYIQTLPVAQIVKSEFFMQFCAGYYLINRWTEALIGHPDVAVRLPQAVAAIVSLLLLYLLGRHLFSTGAGLLATFVVSVSPIFVRYAQENRFYQMGSCGALATYYCFARFLETGRRRYLIGLIVASVLLMQTYTYGFVFVCAYAPLFVFVALLARLTGPVHAPYLISRRVVIGGAIWAAIIGLLFLPVGLRILTWILSGDLVAKSGAMQGKASFDAWWVAPFGLGPQALLRFLRYDFMYNPFIVAHADRYGLLIVVGLFGALWLRRGRVLLCLLFYALVTLAMIHVSNICKSVVMAKRFLYLYPIAILFVCGGIGMLVAAAERGLRHALDWLQSRGIAQPRGWVIPAARALLWLVFVRFCILPPLGPALHQLIQDYYQERVPYKTLARVLQRHIRPDEPLWWYPPRNDGWLIGAYLSDELVAQRVDMNVDIVSRTQLDNAVAAHGGVWLHQIDPARAGLPHDGYAAITLAGRTTWLVRAAYSNDPARAARDQEALLRTALAYARCPETAAARALADMLLARGDTNAADAAAETQARFPWSLPAAEFLLDYYTQRGAYSQGYTHWRRIAKRFFWMPEYRDRTAMLQRQRQRKARASSLTQTLATWSADWTQSYAVAQLDDWYELLDAAARSPRDWQLIVEFCREHGLPAPTQPPFQRLDTDSAERLAAAVTPALWPVYAWLIERGTPTASGAVALLDWPGLAAHGMPAPNDLSDATLLWFERFYRRYGTAQQLAAFERGMAEAAPRLAAWVAVQQAERFARSENMHAAVRSLDAATDALTAEPRALEHAFILLAHASTPRAAALASNLAARSTLTADGTAQVMRVSAALADWRTACRVTQLDPLIPELLAVLTNTAVRPFMLQILAQSYADNHTVRSLAAALTAGERNADAAYVQLAECTRSATWPLYLAALAARPAHVGAAAIIAPKRIAQIGFPAFADMSAATLLWFEQFYRRYGTVAQRDVFYRCAAPGEPTRLSWSTLARAELYLENNRPQDAWALLNAQRESLQRDEHAWPRAEYLWDIAMRSPSTTNAAASNPTP